MIGGTGFLGWFTTSELVARGHDVVAVGLEPPAPGTMPPDVATVAMDVDAADPGALGRLLDGADVLVHAAGADGRAMFDAPAIDGFRRANVEPMRRLLPATKARRVRRLVILGSYYTALDRLFPELGICERNAYPRSRREQADLAFELAGDDVSVGVLELPYIFGAAPGRGTLWGFYIDAVRAHPDTMPVAPGGSACVTATQVARAAAGACERLEGRRHFPIGGENLRHASIYRLFADALGLSPRFGTKPPDEAFAHAHAQRRRLAEAGKETGYDPVDVARWQSEPLFLDPLPAMEALGHGPDDLAEAVRDTVRATLAHGGQGPARLGPDDGPRLEHAPR
jgi:nucleoside-diphosphate-sugar epimerase